MSSLQGTVCGSVSAICSMLALCPEVETRQAYCILLVRNVNVFARCHLHVMHGMCDMLVTCVSVQAAAAARQACGSPAWRPRSHG